MLKELSVIPSETSETQALLACLNYHSNLVPPTLNSSIDWSVLLAQAEALGVNGLLHYALKEDYLGDSVPENVCNQSKKRFYLNQVLNMKLYARLKEVLQTFAHAGIEVIVLKGAALAALTYPQIGLRPMGDADLLVRDQDLDAAEQLLMDLQFWPNEARHSKEWFRADHHHIVPYISKDHSLAVELHHHIISSDLPVVIPIGQLWERSRSAQIAGCSCRTFSPEDFLIHLSLHLAGDAFMGKVRVLVDIAKVIEQHEEDIRWDLLVKLAVEYRVARYLYYSLLMSRTMVGANVPEEVLRELSLHRSRSQFVDRTLTRLIRDALTMYDRNKHPWYLWVLRNACGDLLSNDRKIRKIVNIMHRTKNRYHQYSHRHAEKGGYSSGMYSTFGYPGYLLSKALGLQKSLDSPDKKSSQQ